MLLTMTVVAAIHDVPLAQCELPVPGNERRRETETPETQRAVSGMFNRVIFWSFFYLRLRDCKCVPPSRGITVRAGETCTRITAKVM